MTRSLRHVRIDKGCWHVGFTELSQRIGVRISLRNIAAAEVRGVRPSDVQICDSDDRKD
jgi:hypothetical protein